MENLVINKLDVLRLQDYFLKTASYHSPEVLTLMKGIKGGHLVAPSDIPNDVVTMNSIVRLNYMNSNKSITIQLVYPQDADLKQNKVSILAPVAAILLGKRKDDTIEWNIKGKKTEIMIDEIIYQPEAAGDFHL